MLPVDVVVVRVEEDIVKSQVIQAIISKILFPQKVVIERSYMYELKHSKNEY